MFYAVLCDAKHNWYQCFLRCYVLSVTRFYHFINFCHPHLSNDAKHEEGLRAAAASGDGGGCEHRHPICSRLLLTCTWGGGGRALE